MKLFADIDKRIAEAEKLIAKIDELRLNEIDLIHENSKWALCYDAERRSTRKLSIQIHNIAKIIDFPLKEMADYKEYRMCLFFWQDVIKRIKWRVNDAKKALKGDRW